MYGFESVVKGWYMFVALVIDNGVVGLVCAKYGSLRRETGLFGAEFGAEWLDGECAS